MAQSLYGSGGYPLEGVSNINFNTIYNSINELLDYVEVYPDWIPGYLSENSFLAATTSSNYNKEIYAKIYAKFKIKINITHSQNHNMWAAIAEYDKNNNNINGRVILINNVSNNTFSVEYNLDSMTEYVIFSFRSYDDYSISIKTMKSIDNLLLENNNCNISYLGKLQFNTNKNNAAFYLKKNSLYIIESEQSESCNLKIGMHNNTKTIYGNFLTLTNHRAYFIYTNDDNDAVNINRPDTSPFYNKLETLKLYVLKYNYNIFNHIPGMVKISNKIPLEYSYNQWYYDNNATTYYYSFSSRFRIKSQLLHYCGKFKITLDDYNNYNFAIIIYNYSVIAKNNVNVFDSGWLDKDIEFIINPEQCFGIVFRHSDDSIISSIDEFILGANPQLICVDGCYNNFAVRNDVNALDEKINLTEGNITTIRNRLANIENKYVNQIGLLDFDIKPIYDHLFVINPISKIEIPHESLYHLRLSKSLGFNVFEVNVGGPTTDGVYIVNHLQSNKFSQYFHHIDGNTDISDINVSSVSWDYIVENVRYNCNNAKYRTRPFRLEEILGECKQQGIIPFVMCKTADVIRITENIMGKNNFIAYGGSRQTCPNAIIYSWQRQSTKQNIIDYCNSVGKPFIYGMVNPDDFTDEELQDIVNSLHQLGYYIGTSYQDNNWCKLAHMGFDLNGSQHFINRIQSGNLYNFSTVYNFNNFIITGATETNGILEFSSAGTIVPKVSDIIYNACIIDIEVHFVGTILFNIGGEYDAGTFTSAGDYPIYIATLKLNKSASITLNCSQGTIVYDIKFKASSV